MSFQGSTFFSALNKIGIESVKDYYKEGNWFGNSSLDGITIYKYVTYNMSELLNSIDILYDNGKKEKVSNDNLDSLKPRTINSLEYGRCYELVFNSIYNSILSKKLFTLKIYTKWFLGFNCVEQDNLIFALITCNCSFLPNVLIPSDSKY